MIESPKEIVKRLAEIRCPEYYEMERGDGGSCRESCKAGCHGTGRRFWQLVKKCTKASWPKIGAPCDGTRAYRGPNGIAKRIPHKPCRGSGLILVEATEKTALTVLDSEGYLFTIQNTPSITMARFEVEIDGQEPVYCDDLNEALWQALAAVIEKEVHGQNDEARGVDMMEPQQRHKPKMDGTRHVYRVHVFDVALGKDIVLEVEDELGMWDDKELFRRHQERQGRG